MPRLLMVVFEFPPSNGASVQRIISFYNAYVKAGWVVDVLTVSEHNYETLADTSSLLPNDGGKILRAGALDVQKDLSWRGKYLGPLMTPDRWGATWIPSAILKGVNHIRHLRPDLILSSAPIPSVNVIARVLSKSFGVKWIADYRDPMHYFHGSTNKRLNYILEKIDKSVVENADALTFATSASQSLYIEHFANSNLVEKSIVIENGFSEDNFEKLPKEYSSALFSKNKISFYYAGVLYPNGRDPKPFFEALAEIKKENLYDFEVVFQGVENHGHFAVLLDGLGLSSSVSFAESVPFSEALINMLCADCLVLIQDEKFNNQVPGKVYEYLRTGKPILLKTPVGSATYITTASYQGVYNGYTNYDLYISLKSVMHDITAGRKDHGDFRDVSAHSREGQASNLINLSSELLKI